MEEENIVQPDNVSVRMSGSIDQLAAALSAAQGIMQNPTLNQTAKLRFWNDDNKGWDEQEYSYADLDACLKCVKEPFGQNGLSIMQLPTVETFYPKGANKMSAYVTVDTILAHKSGQWVRNSLTMTSARATSHGIGSAITYGRRYGLCAIAGIAADRDDDAAGAMPEHGNGQNLPSQQQTQNKAPTSQPASQPPKTGSKSDKPARGQKSGKARQSGGNGKKGAPYVINDEEQKKRGCINRTLVAELRQACIDQQNAGKLDITSQFLPWLDGEYLDGLYQALQSTGAPYERKHKGTAQVLLDIPASGYKEILERVLKEPETCRPGYAEAAAQASEQSDDGVI